MTETMREQIRRETDDAIERRDGERTCPVCGEAFTMLRPGQQFCSRDCRNEANRYTVIPAKDTWRGETAAIVPSEMKPIRTSKMTGDELIWWLDHFRRQLDEEPKRESDRWWRNAKVCEQAWREAEHRARLAQEGT
jgi:hypothetical protein